MSGSIRALARIILTIVIQAPRVVILVDMEVCKVAFVQIGRSQSLLLLDYLSDVYMARKGVKNRPNS